MGGMGQEAVQARCGTVRHGAAEAMAAAASQHPSLKECPVPWDLTGAPLEQRTSWLCFRRGHSLGPVAPAPGCGGQHLRASFSVSMAHELISPSEGSWSLFPCPERPNQQSSKQQFLCIFLGLVLLWTWELHAASVRCTLHSDLWSPPLHKAHSRALISAESIEIRLEPGSGGARL